MPSNSTGPADDLPPIAKPDSYTLTAQQASLVNETRFSYIDWDPESPTYLQTVTSVSEVFGYLLDVTANDIDPNPNDANHFWIFDLQQPVDALGRQVGSVSVEVDANGRQQIRFYVADPDQSHETTLTFTYRAGDQWATEDRSTWSTTVSQPTTVTVKISGNAYPGQVINGLNPPNVFTPDSKDPRILYQLRGNDVLNGGNNKDTIDGGAGDDTIHGGNGADSLMGGAGNDLIFGDNGPDTLNGGPGDDTLTGGNGPDVFVFDYNFGHDVITDFDVHNDQVVADHNMWGSWQDFMAHAKQVGSSVVVTSDFGGNTITFLNLTLKALATCQSDFMFV